jgi:hypothetical protein
LCLLTNCADPPAADPREDNATLNIGGGHLEISVPIPLAVNSIAIMDWVQRAASAVTRFYGR